MSSPRYKWWSYVQSMIRLYPGRLELLRDMQSPGMTADYSAEPRAGGASRTTERLAMASLGDIDREVEAVRRAIEETEALRDGQERLKLVRLYYWGDVIDLESAGMMCYVSKTTAGKWHGDFVRCVARHFGLPMDKCG